MALGVTFAVGIKGQWEIFKAQNERKSIQGRRNGMTKVSEAHCLEWPVTDMALKEEGGRDFVSRSSGKSLQFSAAAIIFLLLLFLMFYFKG